MSINVKSQPAIYYHVNYCAFSPNRICYDFYPKYHTFIGHWCNNNQSAVLCR